MEGEHTPTIIRLILSTDLAVQARIQPGPVLFEPGHTGLVLQGGPDPLCYPPAALQLLEGTTAAVPVWNEQLQRFRQSRCNHSDSKGPLCPPNGSQERYK